MLVPMGIVAAMGSAEGELISHSFSLDCRDHSRLPIFYPGFWGAVGILGASEAHREPRRASSYDKLEAEFSFC